MQPATVTWTVSASGGTGGVVYLYQPVILTVKDSQGIPLKNVGVTLSLDLSQGTTFPTSPAMALYLTDPQGNPQGSPVTSPIQVRTGNFGTIDLWVGMATGYNGAHDLNYTGVFYADSGSLQGTASLAVKCVPTTATPPVTCK